MPVTLPATGTGTATPSILTRAEGSDEVQIVDTLSYPISVAASFTRPADTTTYAVNDAMSGSSASVLTFNSILRKSAGGVLLTDMVVVDSANQTLALQGELWLFNASPTAIADNAAFTITDAEAETIVGIIPFVLSNPGNSAAGASGNIVSAFPLSGPLTCIGVGTDDLFGLVKVVNAYVPVSGEKLTWILKGIQVN